MRSAAPRIEAHYQYYSTGVEPLLQDTDQDGCGEWVLLDSAQYCDVAFENPRKTDLRIASSKPLPFDRVLGAGPAVTLYTDVTSSSFGPFHSSLVEKARRGEISYRVRYRRAPDLGSEDHFLHVSGYGVELALKKTDYIVIDDREAAKTEGIQHDPSGQAVLDEEDVEDLKPLTQAELASLGLNAASLIMKSEEPLETLIKFTQDFPKYSSYMASNEASPEFIEEQRANLGIMVPSGVNVLWMNGVQLIERQIEPFNLVDMLRRERKLISEVRDVGVTGNEAILLLSHPNVTSAKINDNSQRFDWRDDVEGGNVIMWLNDLENDALYEDFPTGIKAVSPPMTPREPLVAMMVSDTCRTNLTFCPLLAPPADLPRPGSTQSAQYFQCRGSSRSHQDHRLEDCHAACCLRRAKATCAFRHSPPLVGRRIPRPSESALSPARYVWP